MKVNHPQNYNTYEGANKPKILEKYLFGNNETGDIPMLNYVKNINVTSGSSRRFEAMNIVFDHPNKTKPPLELQDDLTKLISKNS